MEMDTGASAAEHLSSLLKRAHQAHEMAAMLLDSGQMDLATLMIGRAMSLLSCLLKVLGPAADEAKKSDSLYFLQAESPHFTNLDIANDPLKPTLTEHHLQSLIEKTTAAMDEVQKTVAILNPAPVWGRRSWKKIQRAIIWLWKVPLRKFWYVSIPLIVMATLLIRHQMGVIETINAPLGLVGEYYQGIHFEHLVDSRKDLTIDFNWSDQSPTPRMHELGITEGFSVRWTGNLDAPVSGKYVFSALADDGFWLDIDGISLISVPYWGNSKQAFVHLEKGRHKIKVEYNQFGGPGFVHLYWIPPAAAKKQLIPKYNLFVQ